MKKLFALAVAAAFALPTFAITLETGDTIKIKNIEYKVSSVGRNTVTIDPKETTSTKAKTTTTTKTSTSSSKYIDAK